MHSAFHYFACNSRSIFQYPPLVSASLRKFIAFVFLCYVSLNFVLLCLCIPIVLLPFLFSLIHFHFTILIDIFLLFFLCQSCCVLHSLLFSAFIFCFSHFPLIPLKFLPHPLPYFLHSFYFYLINFSLFFCIISVISLHSPREINAASFACFPFLFFIFLTFPFYLKRFTTASERGRCISVPLCACRHECRLSILSSPPRQVRHSRELRNS